MHRHIFKTSQITMKQTHMTQERTNNARKKLSAFVRVSVRKARQSKVNRLGLATLSNFRGFWVIGAVPSFLALR